MIEIKFLLHEYEGLGLDPQHPCKSQAWKHASVMPALGLIDPNLAPSMSSSVSERPGSSPPPPKKKYPRKYPTYHLFISIYLVPEYYDFNVKCAP